jgi:hypothetical protein
LELERAEGKKEPSEARTALAVKLNPNPVVRRQTADREANQKGKRINKTPTTDYSVIIPPIIIVGSRVSSSPGISRT